MWAAILEHRTDIKKCMENRAALRGSRRSRKTRYRQARFNNRKRDIDWFPPTIQSILSNILTWVNRLCKLCNIKEVWIELPKFDTQKAENKKIKGKQYQEGTLKGFKNLKEYVKNNYNSCFKCGITKARFEVDHIIYKSHGGSNRILNSMLLCDDCNRKKRQKIN